MSETVQYSNFRWFAAIALVIVTASTSFTMLSPAPFVPVIAESMKISLGESQAITMFTFNMVMAIFALIGGALVDKLGVERNWVIGLIIMIIGSLLIPVIGSTPKGLIFVRILHAIGTGPIMASIASFCAQRFKYEERTYIAALQGFGVTGGISLGFMITPKIFGATGSWQTAMTWTVLELGIGLIFALVLLFGPKPPVTHTLKSEGGKLISGDFKKALSYITVYVLLAMAFIDSWCQQAFNDMAPGYYAANAPVGLGLGPEGAGANLMWAAYAMMLGTLAAPLITEKIFKGKPQPTIFIGLAIAAASVYTVRMVGVEDKSLLILVPSGILFFSSFVNPTVFGYIAKHYPETVAGKLGGFVMAFSVWGAAVGLAISSVLLHNTGFYWASMNVLMIVTLVGAFVVFLLRPPKGFNIVEENASKRSIGA